RRRHTRWPRDWSSDVCSSDLGRFRRVRSKRYRTDVVKQSKRHGYHPFAARPTIRWGRTRHWLQTRGMPHNLDDFIASHPITKLRSEERRVGKERRAWRAREND